MIIEVVDHDDAADLMDLVAGEPQPQRASSDTDHLDHLNGDVVELIGG